MAESAGADGGAYNQRGDFCGWLDMRVKLGWEARWCELSVDTCTFARSHKRKDSAGRKMYKLQSVSVWLIEESKSGKRFAIDHADPMEMKAKSKEDAQNWIRAIHEVQSRQFSDAEAPPSGRGGAPSNWREILAAKDAEIAALRRELRLLKSGGHSTAQPTGEAYEEVFGRIRNKVERVKSLADMETLHTDSSDDSDDDHLFTDAKELFSRAEDGQDWSDDDAASYGAGVAASAKTSAGVGPVQGEGPTQWLTPPGGVASELLTNKSMAFVPQRTFAELKDNEACPGWAEEWNLRIGPNYKKTGAKGPSPPSFYECVACTMIKSNQKVDNIGSKLSIPTVDFDTHGLPACFIMNCQVPDCENPSMFSPEKDGPTLHVVYIFKIKRSTAAAAADLASASPALRLWAEYCSRAIGPSKDAQLFKGRMKLMMKCEKGLPKMFDRYNGKPTLLTGSSTIMRGEGYLECDANLRCWCYPAKAGIYSMWSAIPKLNILMNATIEARSDDEMNEVSLGCCLGRCMDFESAIRPFD